MYPVEIGFKDKMHKNYYTNTHTLKPIYKFIIILSQ